MVKPVADTKDATSRTNRIVRVAEEREEAVFVIN